MTKRAKRYSSRAATIAVLTVALGLLIWALIAFAAGSVTTNNNVPLGTAINSTLSGGFNTARYYAEYWGPTADNGSTMMRNYSAVVTSGPTGGATNSYTTNASKDHVGNWTARYLYNPNYQMPQYIVIDTPLPTSAPVALSTAIPYKFHLVDRFGNIVTTNHLSDLSVTLRRGTSTVSGVTWAFSGGYYTYTYAGRSSATLMRLDITGASGNTWLSSGTTGTPELNDAGMSNTKSVRQYIQIGTGTTTNAYNVVPYTDLVTFNTLNTSGEARSSMIYVPGTPNPYLYTFQFDIYNGNGAKVTSTTGITLTTATAQGAGGGAAAFNYNAGSFTYNGLHFQVQFNLPGPDKYGIYIQPTQTNAPRCFQVVNLAACSPTLTVGAAKTPPAAVSTFTVTPGDRKNTFGWTNPSNPTGGTLKGILILRKLDPNTFSAPTDGTNYALNATVGTGNGASTVVYKLDPATAGASGQTATDGKSCPNDTGTMLTTGTNYYYAVYAYDSQYSYGPGYTDLPHNPAVPYDTTPPAVVTPYTTGTDAYNGVAPTYQQNIITWTPPADCDYHGVTIYARTDGNWPSSPTGADGSRKIGTGTYTTDAYASGATESLTDTSLINGTQVYYSIWTHDDDGNINSTPVHFGPMAPKDNIAPGQVSGSAAPTITAPTVIAHDAFTVTLQWYAPANNNYDASTGNATAYDIRYSDNPITDANWNSAYPISGTIPSPVSAGGVQTCQAQGLSPTHNYYFAIRARDSVFNWSTTSMNAVQTTECNAELTQCNQCHQMPPTDGLPGESPRSTGNVGVHFLPIHTGGGNPAQCNVCHANGQVYDEVNNKLIYSYNHQNTNQQIFISASGMIGNKLYRDNKWGGRFVSSKVVMHKNPYTGYSTFRGYTQINGYCVNTYCHGQGAGAAASPIWGQERVTCGQTCHETPPATGKHVKHYHPGKYYLNEAPVGYTPVSGYTNDTSVAFWSPSNLVRATAHDSGSNMEQGGNADPRYATYVASSNATRTLPGLSHNSTYYVTVCVGDSAGAVTNQQISLATVDPITGPWTTILSGDTAATRLFKKTVDYPFLVGNSGNLYIKIGDNTHVTKLNFIIVNISPEAPTTNNTVLANTIEEYGFACGKCHYTSDNPLEKHTTHTGGAYRYTVNGNTITRTRDAEMVFDTSSNPKNPLGNYTALFGTTTSFMDGQRFFYTLGSQCTNLYCHGSTLGAGGTNNTPRWTGGYIDEQGSSICGSCHDTGYKDSSPLTCITSGTHKKHVSNQYPYQKDCSDCHSATVNLKAADGTESIKDKTKHVNGIVDVVFDPIDPTMKLGHYSAVAGTPKYGYCSNVYCHSNGLLNSANQPFGATRYSRPQWSVSKNVPCDFCHGSGSGNGTPLYFNSASTFNSHPTHTKTNGIKCGICHNNTIGADGQTVILKNNTCFHVNGSIDVYFNYSVVKVASLGNPGYSRISRQCSNTYCHGTVAPIWGQTVVACGDCHVIPPNYGRHDVHNRGNYGNLTTGNTANANKSSGSNYDFDCRFCHYNRSHGTGAVSSVQSAEVNFNTIAVQNAYNNSGSTYTPGLTGIPDNKGWNYSAGTCSVKCHQDGKNGAPNVTNFNWNSPLGTLGCFGCHGGIKGETPEMSTGRHQAHIDTAPYAFTCDDCHSATASVNSIAHAEKHVNGSVDVAISFNSVGGTWSGSTCTGTYCHSNGNPGFDMGAVNYFATSPPWSGGTMTCTTCHSDNHYGGAGDGVRSSGQTLSVNHQRHLGNYTSASYAGYGSRIGCTTCHNATASSNTAIQITGTTHVNGNKDIVFWTASTAGTAPRAPFLNMTGPNSAVVLTGIWGAFNSAVAGKDLSCTVLCHADGRGNPPNRMPNWSTHQGSYGCGSCHGYTTATFNTMTSGSHKKHVAGASNYACGTCHRLTASGAFGAAYINRSGFQAHHVNGTADVAILGGGTYSSGVCYNTTCHGASSPVWGVGTTNCASCHNSPPKNAQHFGHYTSTVLVTATDTADASTATMYRFGCGKCHLTPPATHLGGSVKSNQTAQIYFDSGTNPTNGLGTYTTTNLRLYTSSTFRESKGLCRNLYCHGNGRGSLGFINWSTKGQTVTCKYCHGPGVTTPFASMTATVAVTTNLSKPHARHLATELYGFTCDDCHKYTASSSSALSNKTNHVNGVKDTYLASPSAAYPNLTGFYTSGTQNCRNVYCHSDGNGGHIGSQLTWSAAGRLACTACHLGNAASGSPITTGKHTAHINNTDTNITKYGCVRCHTRTVSSDTAVSGYAYHVNGTKDVYFQTYGNATGFYLANKTCRNNYCHSSGQHTTLGNISAVAFRVATSWTSSKTATCGWCHGADSYYASINGSPNYQNRSTASRMWYNGHYAAGHVSSARDCIHCHLHTVDSFGNLTTGTTHHLDGTRDVVFQGGGTYDPVRRTCTNTSCHGLTTVRWGGPAQNCSNCHSDMGAGTKNTTHYYTGKHQKHTNPATYRYACELCHATKNAANNTTHAGGFTGNQAAEVIFQSATTTWRNWTYKNVTTFRYIRMDRLPGTATLTNISSYKAGAYVAGADNPDTLNTNLRWTYGRCISVWCHSNGQTTPTYVRFPNWSANETTTCASCHGDATSNTLTTKHRNHLNNISTLRFGGVNFTCDKCHNYTASSNLALNNYVNHVDGAREVYFKAILTNSTGGYVSGTQTCRNNYCHSDGRAKPLSNVSAFPAYQSWTWANAVWASGTKCSNCHGTESGAIAGAPWYTNRSTASSTKAWFNSHQKHVASGKDCIKCHLHTTDSFGNLTTGTTHHIDGTRDVVFQLGGTYTAGLKTCVNTDSTACHGTNTVEWGGWRNPATCQSCHLTAVGGATVNDYVYNNGTKAMLSLNSYTGVGHGKSGTYRYSGNAGAANSSNGANQITSCEKCHNKKVSHQAAGSGNFFRLMTTGNPGATMSVDIFCTTGMGCHSLTTTAHHNSTNTAGDSTWLFTPKCVDCHEPHGDNGPNGRHNAYMMQGFVPYSGVSGSVSSTDGIPVNNGGTRKQVNFPANVNLPTALNWTSFVRSNYSGLCQICHTRSLAGSETGSSPGNYNRNQYLTTHNPNTTCTGCHTHDTGFQGAGGSGPCLSCHKVGGTPTNAGRKPIMSNFSKVSHHITANPSSISNKSCAVCHWEGNVSDGAVNSTYHQSGKAVVLRVWGAFTNGTGIVSAATPGFVRYTTGNGSSAGLPPSKSTVISSTCNSCHSRANANSYPFKDSGDRRKPTVYSWDNSTSIEARYFTNATTDFSKYNPATYNVVPQLMKSLSPHGNPDRNQRGVRRNTTWSDDKTATQPAVGCYDCHNSHGSRVGSYPGNTLPLTSYSSAKGGYKAGILKEYTATATTSTLNKKYIPLQDGATKSYSASAGLCFDCHLGDKTSGKPLKNFTSFKNRSSIDSYYDAGRWQTTDRWISSFTYKCVSSTTYGGNHNGRQAGGHFGASTLLSYSTSNTNATRIKGRCVMCHDPHGIAPNSQNAGYMLPALKGTWMTSPYKEDRVASTPTTTTAYPNTYETWRISNGMAKPARYNPRFDYNNPPLVGGGYGKGFNSNGSGSVFSVGGTGADGYFIDDNTFGTIVTYASGGTVTDNGTANRRYQNATGVKHITENSTQFAGLCLSCHTQANLSKVSYTTKSMTVYIHNTVKGWYNTNSMVASDLFQPANANQHLMAYNGSGGSHSGDCADGYIGQESPYAMPPGYRWGANCGTGTSLTQTTYTTGTPADTGGQTHSGYKQIAYHQFPCSKCHAPHTTKLPRLMKTNCMDVGTTSTLTTPKHNTGYTYPSNSCDTAGGALRTNAPGNKTTICHNQGRANTASGGGWNIKTGW